MGKELLGSLELNRIYQFNCADGMRLLPDGSIDLTVTSPPYDGLRIYNGYSFDFETIAKELFRITKEGGVVVWVVADATTKDNETGTSFRQALYFKEIGFNLLDTMIYLKQNPQPLNTKKRYNPSFEYMFVFSKGTPKTVNLLQEECKYAGKRSAGTARNSGKDELSKKKEMNVKEFKIKNNVWTYVVGGNKGFTHPAVFPEQLAEDHILSWSNEEDIIFDPFMGSGTTATMAQKNKRKYIGFEISQEYIELANIRLEAEFNEIDDQKILDK